MNPKNFSEVQILIAAAVIVILAGGIGFVIGRSSQGAASPASTSNNTSINTGVNMNANEPPPSMVSLGNSISVMDQPAGSSVSLGAVTLGQDAWVAIHEARNGTPGNILGARLFAKGEYQTGAVELLRETSAGMTYYAMLHMDDGDHQFDKTKDTPILGLADMPVMATFRTLTGAAN